MTSCARWCAGLSAIVAVVVLGCDGTAVAPQAAVQLPGAYLTVPESSLTFLRPAAGAPRIPRRRVSFWAVNGETREGTILYQKQPGQPAASKLVRLKVDKRSLVNRPDGTPIAPGDSILITMTLVDSLRLIVDFQPQGLVFAPSRPARATFWYLEADHDFNFDGVVNAADVALESTFRLWGQELPGDPWSDLESVARPGTDQVEAKVPGFTRYAVSY
jgi:hypothetical protein